MMGSKAIITRLYQALLAGYPDEFRDEFGGEMAAVFAAALAAWPEQSEQDGKLWPWQLLWRELRDWPAAVWQAHRYARRRKMATKGQIPEQPLPRMDLLAALILFVLPMVSLVLTAAASLPQWLEPVLVVLFWGAVLFALGLALYQRLPGWSLPYLGFLLMMGLVFSQFPRFWNWIYPIFLEAFGPRSLWSTGVQVGYAGISALIMAVSLLVAALVLVNLLRLVPFTRGVWQRVRADWTQLSFLIYGGLVFYVVLVFEEYRGDIPWMLASWLCLAVGAWIYLRASKKRVRFTAIIGGTTAAMWLIALAKWVLIPYQMWPEGYPVSPSEATRWVETSSVLISWALMVLIMAAPVLLNRLPPAAGAEAPIEESLITA
ncbi:MAG: hypothetical protein ACK2UW_21835 [Anaerolineales bacterium]